jgi:hypothetical protein
MLSFGSWFLAFLLYLVDLLALQIDWLVISTSCTNLSFFKESCCIPFIGMETDFFRVIFFESLGVSRAVPGDLWLMEISLFWMGV